MIPGLDPSAQQLQLEELAGLVVLDLGAHLASGVLWASSPPSTPASG